MANREELRRDAALWPLMGRVARAVSAGELEHVACRPVRSPLGSAWLVLRGREGSGLAVWAEGHHGCATDLRRAIVRVRCLAAIADVFGGASAFPLELSAEREPPPEWPRYGLAFGSGECMFACSPGLQEGGLWGEEPWREAEQRRNVEWSASARVRVALWCGLAAPGREGIWLERVRVSVDGRCIEGRPVSGWLRCAEGGSMLIEIGEAPNEERDEEAIAKAQVRVGLGFVELTLEELLSLRPGSVLELGAASPLACTLSVGATELVQGVLEPTKGGFLLRVTQKS